MLKKPFLFYLFNIVLLQTVNSSAEKMVSIATILSQQKSQKRYNSSERSRCYSFSLVFWFVVSRFCARSQITTSVWPSFTIPFVLCSSLFSCHIWVIDTSRVLFDMFVLLSFLSVFVYFLRYLVIYNIQTFTILSQQNKGDIGTFKLHNIYKRFTITVVSDLKKWFRNKRRPRINPALDYRPHWKR